MLRYIIDFTNCDIEDYKSYDISMVNIQSRCNLFHKSLVQKYKKTECEFCKLITHLQLAHPPTLSHPDALKISLYCLIMEDENFKGNFFIIDSEKYKKWSDIYTMILTSFDEQGLKTLCKDCHKNHYSEKKIETSSDLLEKMFKQFGYNSFHYRDFDKDTLKSFYPKSKKIYNSFSHKITTNFVKKNLLRKISKGHYQIIKLNN